MGRYSHGPHGEPAAGGNFCIYFVHTFPAPSHPHRGAAPGNERGAAPPLRVAKTRAAVRSSKAVKTILPLIAAISLLTGCSSVSARKVMALDSFQHVFVEERLNDNQRLHDLFVAELRRIGRQASSGPRTMMPENADAILTYDARWQWDFKTYLIELNVELHAVRGRKKLADARYHQPSPRPKAPAGVVREIVARMFVKA
jgi:hypothetical protein